MANGLPNPLLTAGAARSLVDSVDAFLFDCDGVIWKGDQLIEGVPETLDLLRKMGKKLVFVTNNSRKSRRQYSKKFRALGLEVTEEEIFTSSFAAAMFLKLNNFPPEKKVYVVGEDGILEELRLAGFECLGGPEDGKKNILLEANFYFEHDKSVGAVIVGLDQYFNYYKMQYASLCIRENPGCLFIATNRDPTGHMTSAQEWPGAGTMVAAVSCSVQKEPIVVGKPSSFLMDFLLKSFNLETSRMCMVGDRLDTDILFGQNTGCKTLLVLSGEKLLLLLFHMCRIILPIMPNQVSNAVWTCIAIAGVTTLSELQDASNTIHPDLYTNSIYDLVGLLQQ
uniref:phosphoglycolate phosphatase n=1 Tax=Oryza punctata TaxID=4537 RepID=A0A0E0LZ05_ORYPU